MSFGYEVIAPLLPKFMAHHPDLRVILALEDRMTDLQAEGIDVAVRIGQMSDSSLVATPITVISKVCCASPDYLKQYGTPTLPRQIGNHRLLHYSNISMKDEWSWLFDEDETLSELSYVFAANNAEALRAMAIQGMGITMLPAFSAEAAMKQNQLVPIFRRITPPPSPLFAVRVSRQYTPARVRAFIDFLKEAFA